METGKTSNERARHLHAGMVYFLLWLVALLLEVRAFRNGDPIGSVLAGIEEKNYWPIVLLSASILLFALALRAFWLHFRGKTMPERDGSRWGGNGRG